MKERRHEPFYYRLLGGRKQAGSYLFCILITVAFYKIPTHDVNTFGAYAMWLAVALLGTGALHVIEDTQKAKSPPPTEAP